MRTFDSGATRDTDVGKLDFEGFCSPLATERYAEYMNKNRVQADGSVRDSDNWQKGIPIVAYMKSMYRHFFAVWKTYRLHYLGAGDFDEFSRRVEDELCALKFNVEGMLHETVRERMSRAAKKPVRTVPAPAKQGKKSVRL
jgi:hypothetical protein